METNTTSNENVKNYFYQTDKGDVLLNLNTSHIKMKMLSLLKTEVMKYYFNAHM